MIFPPRNRDGGEWMLAELLKTPQSFLKSNVHHHLLGFSADVCLYFKGFHWKNLVPTSCSAKKKTL